jgi:TonB family protein
MRLIASWSLFLTTTLAVLNPLLATTVDRDPKQKFKDSYSRFQTLIGAERYKEAADVGVKALELADEIYGDESKNRANYYFLVTDVLAGQALTAPFDSMVIARSSLMANKAVYGPEHVQTLLSHYAFMEIIYHTLRAVGDNFEVIASKYDDQTTSKAELYTVLAEEYTKAWDSADTALAAANPKDRALLAEQIAPLVSRPSSDDPKFWVFADSALKVHSPSGKAREELSEMLMALESEHHFSKLRGELHYALFKAHSEAAYLEFNLREEFALLEKATKHCKKAQSILQSEGEADIRFSSPFRIPKRQVNPMWPKSAIRRGITGGYVVVEYTVDQSGRTRDARVVKSKPRKTFRQVALDAVAKYQYSPRIENCLPLATEGVRTRISFDRE